MLIILSAPSGAGKTTLCKKLLSDIPHLRLSISSTSRLPRGNQNEKEKHGVDYFFITREEFEKGIQENLFAEWAIVHDHYYGTSKIFLKECAARGEHVLLDIDVQGAESLHRAYPEDCLSFFIAPPSLEILEQRLRNRGTDSEATILKRMHNARQEMQKAPLFNHIIVNDDLVRAYQELYGIVRKILPELPS